MNEEECGHKADGASHQEEEKHEYAGVAEVEYCGDCTGDRQFRVEIVHTVGEQIDGGEAGSEKRTPPPMIILEIYVVTISIAIKSGTVPQHKDGSKRGGWSPRSM